MLGAEMGQKTMTTRSGAELLPLPHMAGHHLDPGISVKDATRDETRFSSSVLGLGALPRIPMQCRFLWRLPRGVRKVDFPRYSDSISRARPARTAQGSPRNSFVILGTILGTPRFGRRPTIVTCTMHGPTSAMRSLGSESRGGNLGKASAGARPETIAVDTLGAPRGSIRGPSARPSRVTLLSTDPSSLLLISLQTWQRPPPRKLQFTPSGERCDWLESASSSL